MLNIPILLIDSGFHLDDFFAKILSGLHGANLGVLPIVKLSLLSFKVRNISSNSGIMFAYSSFHYEVKLKSPIKNESSIMLSMGKEISSYYFLKSALFKLSKWDVETMIGWSLIIVSHSNRALPILVGNYTW